jgi:hypothetical protein
MSLSRDVVANKLDKWDSFYRNNGTATSIPRVIRGGPRARVATNIETVSAAPDVLQRVFIVTSSLSRAQVKEVFDSAARGTAPPPHFVQLYWLLTSYFSACAEMGVRAYVCCQP